MFFSTSTILSTNSRFCFLYDSRNFLETAEKNWFHGTLASQWIGEGNLWSERIILLAQKVESIAYELL